MNLLVQEEQTSWNKPEESHPARDTGHELTNQPLDPDQQRHLCLFYDQDPAEQMSAVVPFLRGALAQQEQFIYVGDDQTPEQLCERLQEAGLDLLSAVRDGQLKLWTWQKWRQADGLGLLNKRRIPRLVDQAMAAGFKAIRLSVEMTGALGLKPHLIENWEAALDSILVPDLPARVLCQYNRSRLPPEILVAALHTHPLALIGQEACPNSFYEAPLILSSHGTTPSRAARAEWMLTRLREARINEQSRRRHEAHQISCKFETQAMEAAELRERAARELNERQRAEEANRRLAAIVESSDDAIVSKDLCGTIMSWNKGAERLFGYTADEVIGKPITILIPGDRANEEPGILERIRRGELIDHYETVRQRKDGTRLDISLTVSPVKDAQGRIVGASKVARDITARKRAEQALVQAQAELQKHSEQLEAKVQERTARLLETIGELEAFSYSISHDMRAPLRAMQGFSDALVREYGPQLDAQGQDYLVRIRRAAQRLDLLIQDVLAYSRIGKQDLELRALNLDEVLPDIIESYPELDALKAQIEIGKPLYTVVGHEAFLSQVISNLLGNAFKFVQPDVPPQVRIWAEPNDDTVRLIVADNGLGIAPEHQKRIFQIFGRVYSDKLFEGTGIGLAIVKKAVERMGGEVGVESALGQGSRFWMNLRRAK